MVLSVKQVSITTDEMFAMRGSDTFTESLFSVHRLDDFVPQSHPLRELRVMVNEALKKIEPLLSAMYAEDWKGGRPSIAPEKLACGTETVCVYY